MNQYVIDSWCYNPKYINFVLMENKPVLILGVNALGKAAKEVFEENGVVVYGFLDSKEDLVGTEIGDVPVLGTFDDESYTSIIGTECNAFLAIDEVELRKQLIEETKAVASNAIHQRSSISKSASFGFGNYVANGVVVNTLAEIGSNAIIHTNVTIDTEVKIGNFVQIGAGTILSANVTIEDDVFIGAGVTIVSGVTIGAGARVGAGSVVIANVEEGDTVFGNPASSI